MATTTFFASEATEAGALAGHGFTCGICGATQTTSLSEAEAQRMAADHADWHAKAGKSTAGK